ncbi:MAG: nucleotidyl transferase AbiEii/AbiGii toxin family protein [Nocardiopsaceae bacterium]|nr:nucleotidyl transferase AbiEii/AbiGii toxin family protein [Nocardiopsaceae bacterium]
MAFEELHRHVAAIALRAVGRKYEVALAGGNALMVHDVVNRRTEDVDLFVRRLGNVSAAATEIEAALRAAGYAAARIDQAGGLADIWPDAGEELAEWEVTAPDGEHSMQLQAAYFEMLADPVTIPEIGPVLALDDLAGWKTVALANRMMARDYVDVAALLKKYTHSQLIALARERDPGLADADFADAGRRLDRMRDARLASLLPGGAGAADGTAGAEDVAWLRRQFADWPRDAAPREAEPRDDPAP